ncbi:MAG: hypothetical protein ACRD2B_02060 [Terriglobia bacterium]
MTHEEMESTMQFILSQQARFSSDIQQLQASHADLTKALVTVVGVVGDIAEAQKRTELRWVSLRKRRNALITPSPNCQTGSTGSL